LPKRNTWGTLGSRPTSPGVFVKGVNRNSNKKGGKVSEEKRNKTTRKWGRLIKRGKPKTAERFWIDKKKKLNKKKEKEISTDSGDPFPPFSNS